MKIKNSSFNEWLKGQNIFFLEGEYCRLNQHFGYIDVNERELIGLMMIYLLDKGYAIDKVGNCYWISGYVNGAYRRIENSSLFTALKEAIEGVEG